MPRARRTVALVAVLGLVAAAAVAGPPDETSPAEGIEALEAQLGRAVDRVSLPHAARLLGRVESARGYRLPGYGIVFVLAPRTLPGGEGQVYVFRDGAPKHRRVRVETRGAGERGAVEAPDDVEVFERQVLVFQQEAEEARRAAEEEMEQLVQDVRVRVCSPDHGARRGPRGPRAAVAAPRSSLAPRGAGRAAPPPPPPWKFWFESGASRENAHARGLDGRRARGPRGRAQRDGRSRLRPRRRREGHGHGRLRPRRPLRRPGPSREDARPECPSQGRERPRPRRHHRGGAQEARRGERSTDTTRAKRGSICRCRGAEGAEARPFRRAPWKAGVRSSVLPFPCPPPRSAVSSPSPRGPARGPYPSRRISNASVSRQSVPSVAAKRRNAGGEPFRRWSTVNTTAPSPFAKTPATHR